MLAEFRSFHMIVPRIELDRFKDPSVDRQTRRHALWPPKRAVAGGVTRQAFEKSDEGLHILIGERNG